MCGKEDCPRFKDCNQIPYIDNEGNVTCGIYIQYLEKKKFDELPLEEKLKKRIEYYQLRDVNGNKPGITINVTQEDYLKIQNSKLFEICKTTGLMTFMGYYVNVGCSETCLVLHTKIKI